MTEGTAQRCVSAIRIEELVLEYYRGLEGWLRVYEVMSDTVEYADRQTLCAWWVAANSGTLVAWVTKNDPDISSRMSCSGHWCLMFDVP